MCLLFKFKFHFLSNHSVKINSVVIPNLVAPSPSLKFERKRDLHYVFYYGSSLHMP